ncbi:MAG: amino acid adenylation domain-containing protein, partial [bacterium]|nr:amino acid adenylation domain-containing protein [bacterium]
SVVTAHQDISLSRIEIMSEEEKHYVLYDLNDTERGYPKGKTIRQLFEDESNHRPDHVSAVFEDKHLTYSGLNERSGRLGRLLRSKGVNKGSILAIMATRSLEMIEGILAILAAGGAYLPIDPMYPVMRAKFILEDSGTDVILIQEHLSNDGNEVLNGFQPGNIIPIGGDWENVPDIETFPVSDCSGDHWPDLAYVIYTSGSTGKPKGVMVEQRNVINLVFDLQERVYNTTRPINTALVSPYIFDASIKQIFPSLLGGHRLMIVPEEARFDGEKLVTFYKERNIRVSDGTPMHLNILLNYPLELGWDFPVKTFLIGGDVLELDTGQKFLSLMADPSVEIINVYGPTECCDVSTSYTFTGQSIQGLQRIPIGKPLHNVRCYILGRRGELLPIGIPGELHIAGDGLGRGYLNNPEMTGEKFEKRKSALFTSDFVLYRTGDLARWLPGDSGNIEFLGRMDRQVKVRGYRIELEEIQARLHTHEKVKEALVIASDDQTGNKYLYAYLVPVTGDVVPGAEKTGPGADELRDFLSPILPDYMIPSGFIFLEAMPLTPNGKVDHGALPGPELKAGAHYIAPGSAVENQLVRLWSGVLGIDESIIGVESNFFELGGHSLKATILVSQVHKALNVKVPLTEVFLTPTIRGLAQYIQAAARERYASIEPVEKREHYGLSFAQKRLYILYQMDLQSTAYNMPRFIPFDKAPLVEKLEEAFTKLINRHESLRTSFHMIDAQPLQRVHDHVEFEIEFFGRGVPLRSFVRPFDLFRAPLLRVGLAKNSEGKHILMVDMHHIISDGISMDVLETDFIALLEGKALPPLRLHYKDFAQWQTGESEMENIRNQETYWIDEFSIRGEIPLLQLPTDNPRPAVQSFDGAAVSFRLSGEDTRRLRAAALENGSSLFMVMLALTNILVFKLSGQEDIVIGTPIAGRRHADLEKVIGMFVNTLALRNYPVGRKTLKEFLEEVKKQTLNAFENQEYPFEELVEKLDIQRDVERNPLFDVMFSLVDVETGSPAPMIEESNEAA